VNAGLIDDFSVALAPVLFCTGIRLFEGVDAGRVALEPVRAEPTQRVTHLATWSTPSGSGNGLDLSASALPRRSRMPGVRHARSPRSHIPDLHRFVVARRRDAGAVRGPGDGEHRAGMPVIRADNHGARAGCGRRWSRKTGSGGTTRDDQDDDDQDEAEPPPADSTRAGVHGAYHARFLIARPACRFRWQAGHRAHRRSVCRAPMPPDHPR